MKKSVESQIKTIRFDVEKLSIVVKEDLQIEQARIVALEIANKLSHEIAMLGATDE